MNTMLVVITIGNFQDDSCEQRIIAINRLANDLSYQIAMFKASLDSDWQYFLHYYILELTSQDIYCSDAQSHEEVFTDLVNFGLIR